MDPLNDERVVPPPVQTVEIEDIPGDPPTREFPVDRVRKHLAYGSIGLFGVAMVAGFVGAVWSEDVWERTKDFLLIVVPIITLLIGGAVAHYFDRRM
jgi:hypothetical protein